MDADEIAALAAGLGKAMADGLAANDVAREARAEERRQSEADIEEAKQLVEKRSAAMRRVLESYQSAQREIAFGVEDALLGYNRKAKSVVLDKLKDDPRMPRSINYLERYGALVSMQDRQEVLRRLASTLELADVILENAEDVDVQSALSEAAVEYVERVMMLNGIRVAEADSAPEQTEEAVAPRSTSATSMNDISAAIEQAFAKGVGDLSQLEAELTAEEEAQRIREQILDEQIETASKAAASAADAACRSMAQGVADKVYELEIPDAFDGEVVLTAAKDPDLVHELAEEVHASFKTFKEVVQDNGLFAAFASDNSFGACKGVSYDWWWDEIYYTGDAPGRKTYDDIPTSVEEDKDGDTLERSIERMKVFNKQKYWGLLDDDFQQHVDAFWYGFKKLMENVNGLFKVDTNSFNDYCGSVSSLAVNKAFELGMKMDSHQAEQFCKEVERRGKLACKEG